jgi:sodium/bile acid cotransporter 7
VTSGVAFTRASGGDEAGAIFNATLGNLLGIFVTPMSIMIATGRHATAPAGTVAMQLAWQVAAPVALGQLLQTVARRPIAKVRHWLGRSSVFLLLALIYVLFCDSLSRGFAVSAGYVLAAVLIAAALHGALIALAFGLSRPAIWRFSRPRRTAAIICSTQKTAALGLPLLAILYRDDSSIGLVALPLLIYHPLQLLVAGAAVGAWRKYNGVLLPEPTVPDRSAR